MVGPPPASWAVQSDDAVAYEVADGVWRLRLPLPWDKIPHVNAYALPRAGGGVTLVDCGGAGDASCWAALVTGLEAAGFGVSDVRELVLTHYHSDHAGLAARLVDEVGLPVLGHRDHAHYTDAMLRPGEIAAARERRARQEGVPEQHLQAYRTVREEFEGALAPVLPDVELRDGDELDTVAGSWRVLETPGHAPSHVCLHQPDAGLLIAGDMVAPVYAPYFDYGYSADPVAELDGSLARLAGLASLRRVLPGHGRPLEAPSEAITLWREGLAADVEAVAVAVRAQPGSSGHQLMERLYGPDAGTFDGPWRLTRVIGHLRHLRLAGRIERRVEADGGFRYAPSAKPPRVSRIDVDQPATSGTTTSSAPSRSAASRLPGSAGSPDVSASSRGRTGSSSSA